MVREVAEIAGLPLGLAQRMAADIRHLCWKSANDGLDDWRISRQTEHAFHPSTLAESENIECHTLPMLCQNAERRTARLSLRILVKISTVTPIQNTSAGSQDGGRGVAAHELPIR